MLMQFYRILMQLYKEEQMGLKEYKMYSLEEVKRVW